MTHQGLKAPTHYLSTMRRPAVVWEKGSDVTKGVGPTPVLHTHMPKGKTVPSCRPGRSRALHQQ
jgi:hypothetical protein